VFTVVVRQEHDESRLTVEADELTVGRSDDNGLVLPLGHVAPRHARILHRGSGEFVVVDLGTQTGTFVNGTAVSQPTPALAGDRVRIGSYELELGAPDAAARREDREAALVRLVQEQPDEDAPRLVYADWLEEMGQRERAEYVRLQVQLGRLGERDDDALSDAGRRLRQLADDLPIMWRAQLARQPIERCGVAFELACPKSWDKLARTVREDVRFCTACESEVHYAASIAEARHHASMGRCVAVDVVVRRRPNDLDPERASERPTRTAGIILPRTPLPDLAPPSPDDDATLNDDLIPATERDP
jgi:uncharacterized protein (TIGR02996 family)